MKDFLSEFLGQFTENLKKAPGWLPLFVFCYAAYFLGLVIKVPDLGTKVTLAGFGNTLIDGDWNYDGGATHRSSNNGFSEMTLNLVRRGGTPAYQAVVS